MISTKELNAFKKDKTSVLLLLDAVFLVLPGVAIIFLFNPNLFESLDWIKIMLLALSINTPLVFLNAIFLEVNDKEEKPEDGFFVYFTESVMITGLFLYAVVIVGYFGHRTLHEGLIFIGVMEACVLLRSWWVDRKNEKLKKQNKNI